MQITRHSIKIDTWPAPVSYSRIENNGIPAHFFPATGFPFGCYRQMLAVLSQALNLVGLDTRPTWPGIGPPPEKHHWDIYLNDLIAFLDALNTGPVVGIGHSLGGITTIRAAVKRPDLFRAVILLEPALYPATWIRLAGIIPWHIKSKHKPLSSALKRRDTWSDKQEIFNEMRGISLFSRFSDETLYDFLEYGITSNGEKCKLLFRKDWEARIYGDPPYFWDDFKKLSKPVLGIKGKNSNWFLEGQWKKWKKMRKQDTQKRIDHATHLLPLESPEATANIILKWLTQNNI